ncbi:tail fiber domain-containing protein, partial [Marinobacter sp.]|uniref:tail fiber domain-containing protein n=1 Tax=Marinobacter sp. TaxID=50741 RepID=UPI000C892106
ENIRALEIDTTTLYDLKPSTFNHKITPEKVDFGLIAEEVEKFVPELVSYNKEGQVESVKYSLLSVLLLQELKKLRQEIDDLKNEGKE